MTEKELKCWKAYSFELTPEIIEEIVETNYRNSLPHTKTYIKRLISTNGRDININRLSSIIVKEDILDEFWKSRSNKSFIPKYDFSKIPEFVTSKNQKFYVICKNKICGIEIGEYETSFEQLIEKGREIVFNKTMEKYISATISDDQEQKKIKFSK